MQNSNCELKQNKRKHWIDLLRGFCMVAILLDHTEIYYTGDNIMRVCQNVHILFFMHKAPTFSSQGFAIS